MFQWCASGRRKQLKRFNSRLGHQNKCWQSEILKGLMFRILSRDSAVLMALSCYVTDTSKRAEATALSWRLGWAAFTHALPPWNWTSPRRSCRCEHECQDHLVLPAPSYKVCNDLMEPVWAAQVNALRIHSDHVDDVFTDCSCLMLFSACLYINFHYFYKNM